MISIASSIRFRKEDALRPTFDNTLSYNESFLNAMNHRYCHKLYTDDVITIQVKVPVDDSFSIVSSENNGAWTAVTGEAKVTDGTTYDYWEVELDMADYTGPYLQFRIAIISEEEIQEYWISEMIELVTEATDDGLLQVEFFNVDNAFNVDYTSGIAHLLRVESEMKEYRGQGEGSVFDNQEEVTRLKGEVKRILLFKTDPIPRFLAEMLVVALAHDKFFVNEIEFVAETEPEIENNGSNLVVLSVPLTQREVIGLNTHDVGFDCDAQTTDDMIVLESLAASGQISFSITDDYMVLTITGERTAGSPTITAGTTPGGTDILTSMELSASYLVEVALVTVDKASISGGTLYVEISGVGATANIYVATIKNRQT